MRVAPCHETVRVHRDQRLDSSFYPGQVARAANYEEHRLQLQSRELNRIEPPPSSLGSTPEQPPRQ